ncbi:hypothetical protein IT084_13585 [Desulfallas sp. Bu1-1]|nr:hypothetical protein [Desulfallas sp. Bu1-1]MBF7084000.1 hypothetical protein [Desulfallas sp. Bu1-1]
MKKRGGNDASSKTYNQGLTRKEELDRVRGLSEIVDPERGPENKKS